MPLTANIDLNVTGKQTGTMDLGTPAFPFALATTVALTDGVTAGKADRVFTDTRTLGPSATENLDLAGVLADFLGALLTFVTIKALIVKASALNNVANQVQLTRPASNGVPFFMAAGDGIALAPGFVFAWFGSGIGVTVTAATGDLLTVTNSAGTNSVSYDIVIMGTSS